MQQRIKSRTRKVYLIVDNIESSSQQNS